jgi:hypothetical protein
MVGQKFSASLVVGDYMNSLLFDGGDQVADKPSDHVRAPTIMLDMAAVKPGYELDTIWRGPLTTVQCQIRDLNLLSLVTTLPPSRLRCHIIQSTSFAR